MSHIRRSLTRQRLEGGSSNDPTRKRPRLTDDVPSEAPVPPPLPRARTPPPPRQEMPPPSEQRDPSRDRGKALSSSRRAFDSSGRSRSEERAECNIIPSQRKNRRHLYTEPSMGIRPILPRIGPVDERSYPVDGGFIMRGSEFLVCPGVRDNDTLNSPGVASRVSWATILPRDEARIFRNYPEGEDLADVEALRLAQRTVANNAQHRAYRERAAQEIRELKDKVMELSNTVNNLSGLPDVVRNLEDQLSKARQDLSQAKGDLTDEMARSNKLKEDLQQAQVELDSMQSKYRSLMDRNQELEQYVAELESRATPPLNQAEIDSIKAEAVKEYRLSRDCLRRKEDFSNPYVKYGFYLARSWLEKHRVGEEFPELQYTREAMLFEAPDWTKYEPGAEPPDELFKRTAQDDLANLTGPWEPVSLDNAPEPICALDDLDGEDGRQSLECDGPSALDPQPPSHAD